MNKKRIRSSIWQSITIGLFALLLIGILGLAENYGWLEIVFQIILAVVAIFNILWIWEKPAWLFSDATPSMHSKDKG